jgi:acetyltransferase-like isoleucine patch superfamily enzyme
MSVSVEDQGADNRVEVNEASIRGEFRIELRGRRNLVVIGDRLRTEHPTHVLVEGDDNVVTFGEDIHLLGGAWNPNRRTRITVLGSRSRVVLGRGCSGAFVVRIEANGAEATLGEHCTAIMVRLELLETARISLGDDCMMSAQVAFQSSDGHPIFDRGSGVRLNPAEDIRVGDHVWLSAGVRVLKGVEIGSGSVVGAGAVVASSVPANCIAAGVPARVVRENIEWRRDELHFSARARAETDV